jgi:hypothetical protein
MAQANYRTINIDVLDPEAPINFPLETLLPGNLPPPTNSSGAAAVGSQVRQLLRGGDPEGALRHVLDTAPLSGDAHAKDVHLATVVEVLQGIRQGEMLKVLESVCSGEGGTDRADCLMKYMYVGFLASILSKGTDHIQLQRHGCAVSEQWDSITVPKASLSPDHRVWLLTSPEPEFWRGWRWSADECAPQLA